MKAQKKNGGKLFFLDFSLKENEKKRGGGNHFFPDFFLWGFPGLSSSQWETALDKQSYRAVYGITNQWSSQFFVLQLCTGLGY